MGRQRLGLVIILTVLALGGCGGEPVAAGSAEPDEPSPASAPSPSETPDPSEDVAGSADSADSADSDGLPGEAFLSGPEQGAHLGVVGVGADDVLNLRAGPGVSFDVVSELAPLETDVIATGRSRWLDGMSSIWVEAEVAGVTGWANSRFLAYLGSVQDVTAQLGTPAGGSELPELADRVARQWSGDTEGWSTVMVVDGPHHGDVGEITVDVLGMGDDSVMGARLHIFASPDGGRFTARTVEATMLCARGVVGGECI